MNQDELKRRYTEAAKGPTAEPFTNDWAGRVSTWKGFLENGPGIAEFFEKYRDREGGREKNPSLWDLIIEAFPKS